MYAYMHTRYLLTFNTNKQNRIFLFMSRTQLGHVNEIKQENICSVDRSERVEMVYELQRNHLFSSHLKFLQSRR